MSSDYFKAKQLADIGRHEEAIALFRLVQQGEPTYFYATYGMIWSYFRLGKNWTALREAERFVSEFPESSQAHVIHACMLQEVKHFSWRSVIDRAIALNPNFGYAHYIAAFGYGNAKQWDLALIRIETATRLEPHNAAYLNYYSYVLGEMGQTEKAGTLVQSALAIDPNESEFHKQLGRLHEIEMNHELSISGLREAVRLNPSNQSARREYLRVLKLQFWFYRAYRRVHARLKHIPIVFLLLAGALALGSIMALDIVGLFRPYLPALLVLVYGVTFAWVAVGIFIDPFFNIVVALHPRFKDEIPSKVRRYAMLVAICGLLTAIFAVAASMVNVNMVIPAVCFGYALIIVFLMFIKVFQSF